MEAEKQVFLAYLKKVQLEHTLIPKRDLAQRREHQQFIHGLVTAATLFGVSSSELNAIVKPVSDSQFESLDDKLSVPTYLRNNVKITR
ncbi:hypothetical protein SAMN04488136_13576 [Vibrio xiamenensis]|uniref:Uncharacterized protein n=1 Tax=Vibrio xiamenensis TaxID=861298 RepID=A0A1G8GAY8_9VIBR|nr:hypothetical protein [Vibrio xiamenensis]SDH91486.1 hypothetical protein SAMN04488136_13576 [Vibrio xiamenensis]